jgi:hypothetical protein
LTLVRSVDGNRVSGSPIRKCPGDGYDGSRASLDKALKGLEFKHASFSDSSVHMRVALKVVPPIYFHGHYDTKSTITLFGRANS